MYCELAMLLINIYSNKDYGLIEIRIFIASLQAGHIYICDLKIMDGLPTREGQYCAAPICLLYVNGSGQLVPIAIQLQQKPGKENPIFLPSDGWIDWLLAKIYYTSASCQVYSKL